MARALNYTGYMTTVSRSGRDVAYTRKHKVVTTPFSLMGIINYGVAIIVPTLMGVIAF